MSERLVDTTSDGLPVLEWKRRAVTAEAERDRLQAIVDSVRSRTVLDVVAEKLEAVTRLKRLESACVEMLEAGAAYAGLAVPLRGEEDQFHAAEERFSQALMVLRGEAVRR